jgi:hypothetical protein
LKHKFTSPKTPIDSIEKPGIYKIKCDNCECTYIGQTTRKLTERIKEHRRFNSSNTALTKHLRDKNHSISLQNAEMLHFESNQKRLDLLESYYIKIEKSKNHSCLNGDEGPAPNSLVCKLLDS